MYSQLHGALIHSRQDDLRRTSCRRRDLEQTAAREARPVRRVGLLQRRSLRVAR